jgi:CHAT domain/Effector-associated domain 1
LSKNEKLRIALVVSAPSNLGDVEYKRVKEALEKLALEQATQVELLPVVNEANPEAVDDILALEPHIFHFIGHGRFENENQQQVGEIAFVDDIGEAMWVDAGYFSQLFNRHRPGVMMLQACEGAMLSESQAFVGVASRVVQQNIPVVVAMQYEVSNATASRFACKFYKRLAQGAPVDIAVQEGRYAIALSATQYRKRDFAAPVIFMRVQDGYLFNTESVPETNPSVTANSDQINLKSYKREELREALMDAFRSEMDLKIMLKENLDWNLNAIAGGGNYKQIVFNLIDHAESQGQLVQLVEAAKIANPGNPKLRNVYLN